MPELLEFDPAQAINLVPNPSFEVNLTGWSLTNSAGVVPGTFARTAAWFDSGGWSCRISGTNAADTTARRIGALTFTGVAGIPVASSTDYVLQAKVNVVSGVAGASGGNGLRLRFYWYTAAGASASVAFSNSPLVPASAPGVYAMNYTATAPADAAFAAVEIGAVVDTVSDFVDFYIDSVMMTEGAIPIAYFDGDNGGENGGEWTGARHASASTNGFPAENVSLPVMNSSYLVLAHAYPAPPPQYQWASSVDTEGSVSASVKHDNRVISMTVEMVDPTGALLKALQAKVAKIARDGGTLKRTTKTGEVIVFDLLSSEQFDPSFDIAYYSGDLVTVSLVFGAKPYGRGPKVTLADHTETTLPCLVFTESGITGDQWALGELVVTESQGVSQRWVAWGIESRNYSSSADAALFYQAESRTPLGSAATAVGPAGASGSGSNVVQHTALRNEYQAILSTQASGGGNHLTHVGGFRVFARIQVPSTNAGDVSVAWEWAQGDFARATRNSAITLDAVIDAGRWLLADLGTVSIEAGSPRWEGRPIARSTASGDDIVIDYVMFVPVDEGYGEVSTGLVTGQVTAFGLRDDFEQAAGALSGKTLGTGGTWTTTGATPDFQVDATNDVITRASGGSDTLNSGRFAVAGSAMTSATVQVDTGGNGGSTSFTHRGGVVARYVDTSNYLQAYVTDQASNDLAPLVELRKNVAGTITSLLSASLPLSSNYYNLGASTARLRVTVSPSGVVGVWAHLGTGDFIGSPLLMTYDADLATGGALASGKCGIYDENRAATSWKYDSFWAAATVDDAALFASRTLTISSAGVLRRDAGNAVSGAPRSYEGTYLRIPPAGPEGRTLRVIVKASRVEPGIADPGLDDISATLSYTPRYLVIP